MQQSFQNFTKWLKQDIKANPTDRYERRVQQDLLNYSVGESDPLNVQIKSLDQTVGETPNTLNRQLGYTLRKNAKSYTRVDITRSVPDYPDSNVVHIKNPQISNQQSITDIYEKHKQSTLKFRSNSRHLHNNTTQIVIFPPLVNTVKSSDSFVPASGYYRSKGSLEKRRPKAHIVTNTPPMGASKKKARLSERSQRLQKIQTELTFQAQVHKKARISKFAISSVESPDISPNLTRWEQMSSKSSDSSDSVNTVLTPQLPLDEQNSSEEDNPQKIRLMPKNKISQL